MATEFPESKSGYYPPRAGWLAPVARRTRGMTLLPLVVPGMAFITLGRRGLGWGVLAAWVAGGFVTWRLVAAPPVLWAEFQFDPLYLSLGCMAGLHAVSASYFVQRAIEWEGWWQRILVSLAVTGVLLWLIYAPFVRWLEVCRPWLFTPVRLWTGAGVMTTESGAASKLGCRWMSVCVPPHPGPLPPGEGGPGAAADGMRRDAFVQTLHPSLPLPAGEGRGEGERWLKPNAPRAGQTGLKTA